MVAQWVMTATGSPGGMVADADEAGRAFALFADPAAGCEVMALRSGVHRTLSGADVAGLVKAAEEMPAGAGVYFRVNPVPADLTRPANNPDVLGRRWLYIDVDPAKPDEFKDDPATATEKDAARGVMEKVRRHLDGLGWPQPVVEDSGNGYALFYRCDLPNDKPTQQTYRALLIDLDERFSGPDGIVDKSVHNANRLVKLPGTWARKGTPTEERSHRPCGLVHVPRELGFVSAEQLAATAPEKAKAKPKETTAPLPEVKENPFDLRATCSDSGTAYARAALEAEVSRVLNAIPGPRDGRNNALNRAAFSLGQLVGGNVLNESEVIERLWSAARTAGLDIDPGCGEEGIEDTIRRAMRDGAVEPRTVPKDDEPAAETPTPEPPPEANGAPAGPSRWTIPAGPKSDPSKPTIWPLPELLALDLPDPKWAIPGLLSEGLTLLAGKPKLGKSWLALNLALTVAAGGKALGAIQVQPGDVLYLALEDRLRRIRDRARKVLCGLKYPPPGRLSFAVEWPRQDKGGVARLHDWLASVPDPRLVIIDVWAKFRTPAKSKGSAYEQDYDQLTEVKSMADRFGASVLVIHHTRKSAAEDVFDEISGTLGIAGAADGSMVLSRSRGKTEATLAMTGRDIEEQTLAVEFDPETFTWRSLGSAEERLTGELQKRVVDYLKLIGQPTFANDVAEHLDVPADSVRKTLHRLLDKHVIRRAGNAWAYPGDGEVDGTEVPL